MSKEVEGMGRSRRVQAQVSARTEGARRATGVRVDSAAGAGPLARGQRWSAGWKRDVVLRVLRGESLAALSRGRWAWRSTGSRRGGSRRWPASSSA